MFRKILIFVAALAVLFTARAQTETNKSRLLALDEVIRLSLQHNLDVQIERYSPQVAQFNLSGAFSPYDPRFTFQAKENYVSSPGGFNPTSGLPAPGNETYNETYRPGLSGELPSGLRYDVGSDLANRISGSSSVTDSNGVSHKVDRGVQYNPSIGIDLAQPVLKNFWIDASRQQISLDRKSLKISELGVRQRIMDVVNRVEQAYYDLIFAIENVRVQEKGLELAERLLSENKRRVEVGTLAPLDERQAESQAAARRADLLSARRDLDAQQNVLKNLISDDYKSWRDVYIQPVEKLVAMPEQFNLLESWGKGMTQRPDLLQSRIDVERRDVVLRYDRNQLFPQLDLIGSYGRNGLGKHFGDAWETVSEEQYPKYSYGVLFSMPLSNRGPKNKYRASKAEKEQALLILKRLEQNILVQIDDSMKLAQTDFQRVDATKQARLYAEAALDAEQKKLENGKSTSFVVLQLQRDLTQARSAEIRALADYNKALSQLAFNEGTVFERNHLALDLK